MEGVNPDLIKVLYMAIERTPIDFGIAWMGGLRTPEEQNDLFEKGNSQKDGYTNLSKHQSGNAIDLNVFVDGKFVENNEMTCIVAGVMFACAEALGVNIRWGLDWDSDGDIRDTGFRDIYHFELL